MRQSNFELLRIICMFGVLTSHSLMSIYDLHTNHFSVTNELLVFVMNASCLAVNCFVLISGWFQIKQSPKSFYGLWSPCIFWATISCGLAFAFGERSLIEFASMFFFPLTETGCWFLTTYFALFLISPLLNNGINYMDDESIVKVSIFLLLVDVYIGYLHQSKYITIDGYHLVHFVTLYVLGSALRRVRITKLNTRKLALIVIFLIAMMTGLHMCKILFPPTAILYSMRYNSPILLLTSVLAFLMFSTLKFQSKVINWVAGSVLAVYIISTLPFFGPRYYNVLKLIVNNYSGFMAFILVLSSMVAFYFACIIVDKLRVMLCKPLDRCLIDKFVKLNSAFRKMLTQSLNSN